jgi:tetratricopeptide (TPR) repeat protein
MAPVTALDPETLRNYQRLMVALTMSTGQLNLLLAVCNDRNLQAEIIQRYEQALQHEHIQTFRFLINRQEPSVRAGLAAMVDQQPALVQGEPAVVTVLGIEDLLPPLQDIAISQQEKFFGYLQWTREALRQFHFPVILWVPEHLLHLLVEQAPDFWSWRGGVFWFGVAPFAERPILNQPARLSQAQGTRETLTPELINLFERIEALEKQPSPDEAELAALFAEIGRAYQDTDKNSQSRQFSIQFFQRASWLYRQLQHKPQLAYVLEQLGDLYFELKDDIKAALTCYDEALGLYRQVGARLGEANTLKAIGDVLQFLDERQIALERYDEALGLYRQVGARLGEANTLKAIGDVLENDPDQSMHYFEEAQKIYKQIGDQYSQARNLLESIAPLQLQEEDFAGAQESLRDAEAIAEVIDYEPFRQKIAKLQAQLLAESQKT